MIGDRLDTDILGAQNAGFGATILVTRKNEQTEDSLTIIPDFILDDVTELEALLEAFNSCKSNLLLQK